MVNKVPRSFVRLLPAIVCFISILTPVYAGTEREKTQTKNVILIIVDALRPDHLGCYGYKPSVSPVIDELAKDSFVFDSAFSQSCYTLASHVSIFSSLYPKSHGVFDVFKDRIPERVPLLAELCRKEGISTAWFSLLHHPHLDIDIGFGRGFDFTGELGPRLRERENLFNWIKTRKGAPFFLAMNARTVHDPYSPPTEYLAKLARGTRGRILTSEEELNRAVFLSAQKYSRARLPAAVKQKQRDLLYGQYSEGGYERIYALLSGADKNELLNMKRSLYFSRFDIHDKNNLEYARSLYDACILEVDTGLIGPLVKLLKELGIYDNTMIVITADHGEEFAEHGDMGHNYKLYDELVHIPLIIRMPGYTGGTHISRQAQSIDIAPTICVYLGIKPAQTMQGRDLSSMMSVKDNENQDELVYGENPKEVYVRSREFKLISPYNPALQHYLFDLKLDPGEKVNLYGAKQVVKAQRLLEKALEEKRRSLPLYKEGENYFLPEIPPEMRKRIKETGYW